MILFWIAVIPALLLAAMSLRGERARARFYARELAAESDYAPAVTLIVPVKGMDEGLRENLAALAAQDHPDYELIVAARTASDIPPGVLPSGVKICFSNAPESATSEKILNLLAGVRVANTRSQVLAFADSDGRPGPSWLRELIAPLADEGVGVATGYRWYVPEPADFWSVMRSVWNAAIASLYGPGRNDFAWGGAMACRKRVFFELRVPEAWHGAVSDDYALSAVVKAAGLRIAFAPGGMVAAVDHIGPREFFRWIARQMTITRVYNPRLWRLGLLAHVVYCAAMAASVAALCAGHWLGAWTLVLQLLPGMWKGMNRAQLARAALPEHEAWFRRYGWVHAGLVPLATWVWLYAFARSALGRHIEWRGRRYNL